MLSESEQPLICVFHNFITISIYFQISTSFLNGDENLFFKFI